MAHNLPAIIEELMKDYQLWAADNLHLPQLSRIGLVPEEKRDPNYPIPYVVTASAELEKKIGNLQVEQGQASAG